MSPKPKSTSPNNSENKLGEPSKQRKTLEKRSKKRKNPEPTQATRKKLKLTPEDTNSDVNILPQICHSNWDKLENDLNTRKNDKTTEKLNLCVARMHGFEVFDTHFLSLPFLRLAIVDSLLNRKWDNLLRLVVRLGRNYMDPVFRMPIRHLCQILKHYHPAIRDTELADQIDLVVEKYEKNSETIKNINSVV